MNQVLYLLLFLLASPLGFAQPPEAPPGSSDLPGSTMQMPTAGTHAADAGAAGMQSMPAMQSMAESMKAMADMCREMMMKEKAARPYKLIVGGVFAALLAIALVLLIVLELQWIAYWKRLLRAQAP